MRTLLLAATALAFASPTLRADPPLRTDDAYIVDPGRCQIEGQTTRHRGGEREQALEFGCGVNRWLELTVGRASGRTTVIQAKVLPLPMDHSPYGYGLTFGIARSDPFFNLIGGRKLLEDRAAIYVNLGAERVRRASLTRATAGIAVEYSINPSLQFVADFNGRRGEKPAALAGVRLYVVPEHLHLTVAAGRRSTALGFHWNF